MAYLLNNDSSRDVAVNCLLAFEREQCRIQDTLDNIFKTENLDTRMKRQATELAYGTCRHIITLDHIIAKNSNRTLRKIHPVIMQILRVGLYQLIYLQGTPDFAVVDQAVSQAKKSQLRGTDSFVNALLRSVQRDMDGVFTADTDVPPRNALWLNNKELCRFKSLLLPDPKKNLIKYYSLAFAHPPWLIERWLRQFDAPTVRAICLANNSRPLLTLRVNTLRCTSKELQQLFTQADIKAVFHDPAAQLLQPAAPRLLPGFAEGFFYVQDMTAMSVAPVLAVAPGQNVLDLCAAPGGKTTHLAQLMTNNGTIVACDISKKKLDKVEQNCQRLGINIVTTCLAEQLDSLIAEKGLFDTALADVPCSNTGVLARRVEARHLLNPAAIRELTNIQYLLLERAVRAVKPGGKVLYSTCSIEPRENELLIQKFLQKNDSPKLLYEKLTLPGQSTSTENTFNQPDQSSDSPVPTWHDGGFVALLET